MGKMSRNKGAAFEREVARALQTVWPDAHRAGQTQASDSIVMPDVEGTPYWIECKRLARVIPSTVSRAFAQADDAQIGKLLQTEGELRDVLVITRQDRERALVHWRQRVSDPLCGYGGTVIVSAHLDAWINAMANGSRHE